MLIGHGTPSRIAPKINAIEIGGHHDFDFWRMKNDAAFSSVIFRVQRGTPEGTKPELLKTLKGIYGKNLDNTFFFSIWVKGEKMTKTTAGAEGKNGAIPVGFSKEGIINLLRATLSAPVIVK